jgi:hypothetical protein
MAEVIEKIETAVDAEIVIDDESTQIRTGPTRVEKTEASWISYVLLPAIFLLVTLLGGFRLGAADGAFIFLKPALVCLVFAALTLVLYVRSGMIDIGSWVGEERSILENISSAAILLSLFTATVQLYNALLPEQGLTFWVVGFCFFWTIWNNLFAEFDPKRLLRSMVGLFGLAFVVKYLVLANMTGSPEGSWWQRFFENPGKEAFTWLLDLPKYSSGTGYVQFFTISLYLLGLFLLPRSMRR